MAFFVTAVRTAYRRSAEDYVVEALGADSLPLHLDARVIVKRMFADTRHHFEQLGGPAA